MSRIRSIHPGIWTDEEFMGLSAYARLLLIGLWTEAWDDGVFEWKPLTLKARIFPVDPVDVAALLAELLDAGVIARIESGQKQPGVIKNFQKYQRPKKPNSSGLMLDEWLDYVGAKAVPDASDEESSEPVPNQFPTGGGKSPQMEDGGWKREDEQNTPPTPKGAGAGDLFEEVEKVFPRSPHYKPERAEKAFGRLSAADQHTLLSKAKSFDGWWRAEQVKRSRAYVDSLAFAPPLDKWISDGSWRSFEAAPASSQPSPDLVVLQQDDPLIPAIERIRGKSIIFGTRGTATVTKTEVEQAKAQALERGAA
jgi:hypothetical protein